MSLVIGKAESPSAARPVQGWRGVAAALPGWVRHCAKWMTRPQYRSWCREVRRLQAIPKYQPTFATLDGKRFELMDAGSFLATYDEIFEKEIYRFCTDSPTPYIIDGGANVGLSVYYFKQRFPKSRIVAFEPDPAVCAVLKTNCATLGLEGVEVVGKALWTSAGTLTFLSEGGDAGRLASAQDTGRRCEVLACRLQDYLTEKVDLLKLDIEGAETEVLGDCAGSLECVERMFVEYHSFADRPQALHRLLGVLAGAGFRVQVQPVSFSPHPFVQVRHYLGMDLQLNLFAYRS